MENIRFTLEHPPAAVVVVVVGSGGGGGGSVDERLITCRHQVHLGQWKGVQHGRNLGICPHQQSRPNDQFKTEWLLKFPHSFGNFELPHVIRLTLMKGMERLWAGLLMISGSRSGCHILKKLFFLL